MTRPLVSVVGPLGAGKTTLCRLLASSLGWHLAEESVTDNPYLHDFYQNMSRWAFHLQMFFLASRHEKHLSALADPRPAVMDGAVYGDFHVYVPALAANGLLSALDCATYTKIYHTLESGLPVPDLLVYVSAPLKILEERISRRSQAGDQLVTGEYLASIASHFENWLSGFDLCSVLRIDSSLVDFSNGSVGRGKTVDQVLAYLA